MSSATSKGRSFSVFLIVPVSRPFTSCTVDVASVVQ